jgi:DNA-binding response OmpR family regulator
MVPARVEMTSRDGYTDDHLVIDRAAQTAFIDKRRMTLTRKEFELLVMLSDHSANIVRREDLLFHIWGYSTEIRTRTLDVHIRRLRKKLGLYGRFYIETIFAVGYRFQPMQGTQLFGPRLIATTA